MSRPTPTPVFETTNVSPSGADNQVAGTPSLNPARIVGYSVDPLPCETCTEPTHDLVEALDGSSYGPQCRSCQPTGTVDEIARALARAFGH